MYMAAQTVFLLPWAVLAVPVATAVYPRLSRAAMTDDEDTLCRRAGRPLPARRCCSTCLGAAALVALAEPGRLSRSNAPPFGHTGHRRLRPRGCSATPCSPCFPGPCTPALPPQPPPSPPRPAGCSPPAPWWCSPPSSTTRGNSPASAPPTRSACRSRAVAGAGAVRRHAGPDALSGLLRVCLVGIVAAAAAGAAGWGVVERFHHVVRRHPAVWGSLLQGMLGGVAARSGSPRWCTRSTAATSDRWPLRNSPGGRSARADEGRGLDAAGVVAAAGRTRARLHHRRGRPPVTSLVRDCWRPAARCWSAGPPPPTSTSASPRPAPSSPRSIRPTPARRIPARSGRCAGAERP